MAGRLGWNIYEGVGGNPNGGRQLRERAWSG